MTKKNKKRNVISRVAALQRVDDMITPIMENVRIALEVEAALEEANEVVKSIAKDVPFDGARCYNTIRTCMAFNLALALARLFDPGARRYHPNKSDVASIPLLVRLLKQKRCRAALIARAREWKPQFPEFEHLQVAGCEHAIDRAIATYSELRRGHKGRSAVEKLKRFRDKKLAHSLIGSILKSLPQYDQLFLLMDVARDVAEKAELAIRGKNINLANVERIRRRESRVFWERALNAVAADPQD